MNKFERNAELFGCVMDAEALAARLEDCGELELRDVVRQVSACIEAKQALAQACADARFIEESAADAEKFKAQRDQARAMFRRHAIKLK